MVFTCLLHSTVMLSVVFYRFDTLESDSLLSILTLTIVPPDPKEFAVIKDQGKLIRNYSPSLEWQTPEGTRREQIGSSAFCIFWRVTLPDEQSLLEVHIPATGLSVLFDASDFGPDTFVR